MARPVGNRPGRGLLLRPVRPVALKTRYIDASVTVNGVVATISVVAPAGTVSITQPVTVDGVTATITVNAHAGTVLSIEPAFFYGRAFRNRTAAGELTTETYVVSGEFEFSVLASAGVEPTYGSPPTPTAATAGRWQLEDPVTEEIYSFPINPRTADSPEPIRVFTESVTTTGQPMSHEGARTASLWTLGGHISTQAMLEALTAWSRKPNKVFLTDDLGRTWVVYLKEFQHIPRLGGAIWEGTYTLKVLVFGGHL